MWPELTIFSLRNKYITDLIKIITGSDEAPTSRVYGLEVCTGYYNGEREVSFVVNTTRFTYDQHTALVDLIREDGQKSYLSVDENLEVWEYDISIPRCYNLGYWFKTNIRPRSGNYTEATHDVKLPNGSTKSISTYYVASHKAPPGARKRSCVI